MSKLAQIALGGVIAVALTAASVHADRDLFPDRPLSHWQNAQLDADAKIGDAAAKFTNGMKDLIRAMINGSR
jgi:hypothetical protein